MDHDLGFVFWLGQTLDQAGYLAFPAKNCEAATELLCRWKIRIDVLVIGSGSEGAVAFTRNLRLSQPDLKVVAAVKEGESSCLLSKADAVQDKPRSSLYSLSEKWLRVIEDLLGK